MIAPAGALPQTAGRDDAVVRFTLLCLAARRQADPGRVAELRELAHSGEVDWEDCQALAETEKLEPLLFAFLAGQGVLPGPVEARWRLAYRRNAARNALVFHELAHVLRQLAGARVPAILLKGAALALTVYEKPALRPMADLDLLLHPADVPDALEALQAEGYAMSLPELGLVNALEYTNEFLLSRPGGAEIPVELHWGLFNSPFYGHEALEAWLWEGALPAQPVEGVSLPPRIFRPEAQILHLCGHLALHHAGEGLLWLNDIAEVTYHYREQIDWRILLEQAQAADLVLPLQQVLPRVAEGWQAPIPAEALAALGALQPSPVEARVFGGMSTGQRSVASEVWSGLAGLGGTAGRLRYLAAKLLPSAAYMRQRYRIRNAALLPLYYPYRWLLGVRSALSFMAKPKNRKG